jgi:hypothetical protein
MTLGVSITIVTRLYYRPQVTRKGLLGWEINSHYFFCVRPWFHWQPVWPDCAKFRHLGYFSLHFTYPISPNKAVFNTKFVVGISRFQRWFDVDVWGFKIEMLCWYFACFGYFFPNIGQNVIQLSGHTADKWIWQSILCFAVIMIVLFHLAKQLNPY